MKMQFSVDSSALLSNALYDPGVATHGEQMSWLHLTRPTINRWLVSRARRSYISKAVERPVVCRQHVNNKKISRGDLIATDEAHRPHQYHQPFRRMLVPCTGYATIPIDCSFYLSLHVRIQCVESFVIV